MEVREENYSAMHPGDGAVEIELPNGSLIRGMPDMTPEDIEAATKATDEFREVLRGYGEMS